MKILVITYYLFANKILFWCRYPPGIMKMVGQPTQRLVGGQYWFAEASPYALKFLEIMRRVRETNLMRVPALIDKKRAPMIIEERDDVTVDPSQIDSSQLMTCVSSGSTVAAVVFAGECIRLIIGKYILWLTGVTRRVHGTNV